MTGGGYAMSDVTAGIQSVLSSITASMSIANIASIIGIVIAAVVGLFLFWWGARWVVKKITAAFRGGKIGI